MADHHHVDAAGVDKVAVGRQFFFAFPCSGNVGEAEMAVLFTAAVAREMLQRGENASSAVGIDEGGGTGTIYYGVTAVDSDGDESAQSLGISPAWLSSSSGSSGGGGGGCFINTAGQPVSQQVLWLVLLGIAVAINIRRTA